MNWPEQAGVYTYAHTFEWVTKNTGFGPSLLWGPDPHTAHAVNITLEMRSHSMSVSFVDP